MVKNLPASATDGRDSGLIPRSGKSYLGIQSSDLGIRVGNGNLLQYSCLGNPIDRGAWRATVHAKSSRSETDELLFSIKISKMLHITLELLNITA